jgi:hypothetical protein
MAATASLTLRNQNITLRSRAISVHRLALSPCPGELASREVIEALPDKAL